jgi:beta-glucanase (GH16 family)
MNKATLVLVSFLLAIMEPGTAGPVVSPPAEAAAAGFRRLGFHEEFRGALDIGYGVKGHKWNAGLWFEPVPPANAFRVHDGILTITTTASEKAQLCTQYHDASGGRYFRGGYFEARMRCTDWSVFWLYCANRPRIYGQLVRRSNPLTWTSEIDIIETDPGLPNTAVCTIHSNTSGDGGVADRQNDPDFFPLSFPVLGAWHTYGLLWTREQITWYIDNVKVASARPFLSTWQPMQLGLTASPGGVNGSPSSVLPPITEIQWVRVWE